MEEKSPTQAECLYLLDKHQMLPNIREHSWRVMEVSMMVGEALVQVGVELDLPLLEAGALLHDIAKTACLRHGGNHAHLGAEWLVDYGYPALAEIVREHVCLSIDPWASVQIREAEVVNYADKRVMHTQVVSLEERFVDLVARYGKSAEARARIIELARRTQLLEDKLFSPITLSPPDLLCINNNRRIL